MKTILILLCLIVTCSVSAVENPIYLGEIVISANPAAEISNPDAKVIRIAPDDPIRRVELPKILSDASSSIIPTQGQKGETYVSFRGFNQRDVNVLLDGVPVQVPYDGYVEIGKLNLFSIKKIEIVQGASSVLAGPNALAGTINLITEKPTHRYGTLSTNYIQHRGLEGSASFYDTEGTLYYGAAATASNLYNQRLSKDFVTCAVQPDRQRRLSDKQKEDLYWVVGKTLPNRQYALKVSRFTESYGVPIDLDGTARFWKFTDWKKDQYSFEDSISRNKLTWHYNIYKDKYFNLLDSYDDINMKKESKGYAFHSIYDDYSQGINLRLEDQLNAKSQLGFLVYSKTDVHRECGNYKNPFANYKGLTTDLAVEYRRQQTKSLEWTAGISSASNIPRNANGNALPDKISTSDYTLSFKKAYQHKDELYGNFGNKTRFPTLKDRFSGYLDTSVPNPGLKEQHGQLSTLGYRRNISGVNCDLAFFHDKLTDAIFLKSNVLYDNVKKKWLSQNQNISEAVYQGLEFNAKGSSHKWDYRFGFTYNDASDRTTAETIIENVPMLRTTLGVDYHFTEQVKLALSQSINGKSYYEKSNVADVFIENGKYTVTTVELDYQLTNKSFFLRMDNAFDKDYRASRGFPGEGRSVSVGMTCSFK
ncbi:MAG: TonB-dependent receptor plug domain-containing protein [Candidatus Wallbacteria bacterium]|nr:TonB-dependent receptor plug domain-containing protein [Candidatus Wallbacteria bacterium]